MKALALLLLLASPLAGAVLDIQPSRPTFVFGGRGNDVELRCRNQTDTNVQLSIEFQLLQTSSATVAPWSAPKTWRSLRLDAHQTSLETVNVELPLVREECSFLLRLMHRGQMLGVIKLRAFPDTILATLTNIVDSAAVSRIDPELQSVLTGAGMTLIELEREASAGHSPQLTIYGPGSPVDWWLRAVSEAKSGKRIVWIESSENEKQRTAPSYCSAQVGQGVVVVVQQSLLSRLPVDPISQLRLVRILRLAMGTEPLNPLECRL